MKSDDPEFCGSAAQLVLLGAVRAWTAEATATPGLFQGGRLIGIDDLETLGDAAALRVFEAMGAVIVKFIPGENEAGFRERFAAPERRFTAWDVFVGGNEARRISSAYVEAFVLPDGWLLAGLSAEAPAETIAEIQTLQELCGVAPVPGYYQRGHAVPAVVSVLSDETGKIAATAQAYARHHADGPWAGHIFCGMVAVHPDHRRKGLGTLINAAVITNAFAQLECTHVYEHAASDNLPSRAMIEASGLRRDNRYRCVMLHDARWFGEYFTK